MGNLGFDSTGIEPSKDFDLIPAGWYPAAICKSEVKETNDRTGSYLQLEFDVLDGPYKNRKIWKNINLRNKSDQATQIGQSELASLCHAIGKTKLDDSAEAHGHPMSVKVGIEKGKPPYSDKNTIKAFKKLGEESRPAATPAKPTGNGQRPPWAAGR